MYCFFLSCKLPPLLKKKLAIIAQFVREDRQTYLSLQEDCKSIRAQIQILEHRCQVEMNKRFGEGVTLQDMEAFAVNRTLAEMRGTAKRAEEDKYRDF